MAVSQWLTVKRAADFAEVKPVTVRRWCREGLLTSEGVVVRKLGKLYEIDGDTFQIWLIKHYK